MIEKTKIEEKYNDIEFKIYIKKHKKYIPNNNIISVCAFRMGTGYKPSDEYINGLMVIIKMLQTIDWNLRIYYDKSIIYKKYENNQVQEEVNTKWIPTLKYALKTKRCELYRYSFKDFKKKKIFHSGLFGTIVRFMPLFNFPFEKSSIVYISDIDAFHYLSKKQIIEKFMKSEREMLYRTTLCYCQTYYNSITSNIYCPIASLFILKRKLDYNYFIKYLSEIKNYTGFYKEYVERYKKSNDDYIATKKKYDLELDIKKKVFENSKNKMQLIFDNEVCYGADEVFLTNYVVKNLLKLNVKYMVILKLITWHIWKIFRYNNNYFKDMTEKQNKGLNILFKILSNKVFKFEKNNHINNYENLFEKIKKYASEIGNNINIYRELHKHIYQIFKNFKYFMNKYKNLFMDIGIDDKLESCINMCIEHTGKDYAKYKIITN